MKTNFLVSAAAMALLAATAAASAATVTATTDLNVRAGPGSGYPVVGVLGAGQRAALDGCIRGSRWCAVNGGQGWVNSNFLASEFRGSRIVIAERLADFGIEYIPAPDRVVAGVAADEVTAAIVEPIDPPAEVRTYVTTNTMEPVYLDEEIAVGETIPADVEIREIPDYRYDYVYVNSRPVLVEPQSRRIVYLLE